MREPAIGGCALYECKGESQHDTALGQGLRGYGPRGSLSYREHGRTRRNMSDWPTESSIGKGATCKPFLSLVPPDPPSLAEKKPSSFSGVENLAPR